MDVGAGADRNDCRCGMLLPVRRRVRNENRWVDDRSTRIACEHRREARVQLAHVFATRRRGADSLSSEDI